MSISGELLKDTRSSFLDIAESKIRRNDFDALIQRTIIQVLTSADCNHFVRYMDKVMGEFTVSCLDERDGECDTACMIPLSSIKDASDREIDSLMCFIVASWRAEPRTTRVTAWCCRVNPRGRRDDLLPRFPGPCAPPPSSCCCSSSCCSFVVPFWF
jgi:hypothetical protein